MGGPRIELFRGHESLDRVMTVGGSEILPKGQDLTPGREKIFEGIPDFLFLLTHTQHETRLDHHPGLPFPGASKHLQGPPVVSLGPHGPIQARHGLDVVIQHVRPRIRDDTEGLL
jgi:hypothetical protein